MPQRFAPGKEYDEVVRTHLRSDRCAAAAESDLTIDVGLCVSVIGHHGMCGARPHIPLNRSTGIGPRRTCAVSTPAGECGPECFRDVTAFSHRQAEYDLGILAQWMDTAAQNIVPASAQPPG